MSSPVEKLYRAWLSLILPLIMRWKQFTTLVLTSQCLMRIVTCTINIWSCKEGGDLSQSPLFCASQEERKGNGRDLSNSGASRNGLKF